MPRSYHWSIAARYFRKQPASTLRLVLSVVLCCVLAATAMVTWYQMRLRHEEHVASATISLFLKSEMDTKSAMDLASDLQKDATIASVDVQSPDTLRSYFQDRYGVNVAEVLPQNPFNCILRVHLKPEFLNTDATFMQMVQQFRGMNTMVEDVSYQSEYVRAVTRESAVLMWSAVVGGSLLGLTMLLIISFALRAESMYSPDDRWVSLLLGAKKSFLARSALWRVLLSCIVGLIIGTALCYVLLLMAQSSGLMKIDERNMYCIGISALLTLSLFLLLHRRSVPHN